VNSPTIHASAVLIGARAVLIRGPAGSGKSRLALALIEAGAQHRRIPFARLVADDRVVLEAHHGRLIARPPAELVGLVEVRGLGIRRLDHEALAAVGLIVDLAVTDARRLPLPTESETEIAGVRLPRLAVGPGDDAISKLMAFLHTAAAGI
jgi:serine kinase of HPr protein (carbohydrate metabolism regulator)